MKNNDIIEIKSQLTQIVSLLSEIKNLLKEQKMQRESKLPRQI
jgi:hypothetical protein